MLYISRPLSLVICCIGLYLLTGCSKTLELTPETEYTASNYWKEASQATAALSGAYNRLQAALGNEFISYGEARADNLVLWVSNGATPIALTSNTLNPNLTEARWGTFYTVIKQANLILANLPLMKAKGLYNGFDSEYNSLVGQAYGLRALCYYYMVRIWGGVPLVISSIDDGTADLRLPRSDSSVIYAQVKKDLDSAYQYLPSSHATSAKTRANLTKGAVDAMFTDYYMYRHDYDNALKHANNVINNSMYKLVGLYDAGANYYANPTLIDNADYTKMFTQGFSTESIFEIDYNFAEGTTSGIAFVYGPSAQYKPAVDVRNIFDSRDLRPIVCFNSGRSTVMKYFEKVGFNSATQNDKSIILYRLADILLLKAEVLSYKGSRAEAFTIVNQIRARAGADTILSATYLNYTQAQADNYIFLERNRELCFEGKRWFDLVRTGRAIPVMKPINGLSDPNNILWPISLETIRVNSLIEQNVFYK